MKMFHAQSVIAKTSRVALATLMVASAVAVLAIAGQQAQAAPTPVTSDPTTWQNRDNAQVLAYYEGKRYVQAAKPGYDCSTRTLIIPEVEGVRYTHQTPAWMAAVVIPGVTEHYATPEAGYTFGKASTTHMLPGVAVEAEHWSYNWAELCTVTPTAPSHQDGNLVLPEVEGVVYEALSASSSSTLCDPPLEGTSGSGRYTVGATPAPGYEFSEGAQTEWSVAFSHGGCTDPTNSTKTNGDTSSDNKVPGVPNTGVAKVTSAHPLALLALVLLTGLSLLGKKARR